MNTQTEKALKMAIEDLTEFLGEIAPASLTIQVCKEALKQPAQKPVIIAIAQNEPPRVMLQDRVNGKYMCFDVDSFVQAHLATEQINGFFNAITHPKPSWQGNKEFVGLSDDEKLAIIRKWKDARTMREQELIGLGDAFEQELKTKNGFSGLKDKNT